MNNFTQKRRLSLTDYILLTILIIVGIFVWLSWTAPEKIKDQLSVEQPDEDLGAIVTNVNENTNAIVDINTNINNNTNAILNSNTSAVNSAPIAKTVPSSASIQVPFTTQAPFSVWDALHEDACEEASLLMIKHFEEKTNFVSKDDAEAEIKSMIEYEESHNFGLSITLKQLNTIASDYLNLKGGVVNTSITIDDIKLELSSGRPVIVGAAGKLLKNPNFKNGGPNYHMLVIKGYDSKGFITNDPGTRLGENYRYDFATLYNAIHDFDEGNIVNGQKAYLVFK